MKQKSNKFLIIAVILLAVALLAAVAIVLLKNNDNQLTDPTLQTQVMEGDGATLENATVTHYATMEIEDYGTIVLELYGNTAPITVNNFVTLAESGFYNGLKFHRIIEGFMMQGGGAASGDTATIVGEFAENGIVNNLEHKRGVISMARTQIYNSATSQFFIMHETKPHLDGKYAAFGCVIEGIEVVDAICAQAQPVDNNGSIAQSDQPVIKNIMITYP